MHRPEAASSEHPFSVDEVRVIGRVACLIIGPCTELGLPGADDEAILSRILRAGARHEHSIRTTVQEFVSGFGGYAAAASLPEREADLSLHEFLRAHGPFAELLMCLSAESYYQDERVLKSLDMDTRPPFPAGRVVEQGDWTLLDAVKRRDEFYRQVQSEAACRTP